jgi:hypothetical protein
MALRALIFAFGVVSAFAGVENCGSSSDVFTITKLGLDPVTPVVGMNLTMTMDYTVPVEINDGTAHYSCVLNGLPVADSRDPICKDTQCPITVGEHTSFSTINYPNFSGKLDCKTTWTLDNQQLLCVRMLFKS